MNQKLDYTELAKEYDTLAPDGSEIRLLSTTSRGSMVHCTLNPGETSAAVAHRTVEEVWYFLEGTGQVWRRKGDEERVVDVAPGREPLDSRRRPLSIQNNGRPSAAICNSYNAAVAG